MKHNYTLTVSGHFDAAHRLPGYQGPCRQLHGHTWQCEVRIDLAGVDLDDAEDGMLVDFADVKECWKQYDHTNLNQVFGQPTCEAIARAILADIQEIVDEQAGQWRAYVSVTLCESESACVTVSAWRSLEGALEVEWLAEEEAEPA